MPKPKEIDQETLEKRKRRLAIITKVALFLLLTFILASLCTSKVSVIYDYYEIKYGNFSFFDLFTEARPPTDNPAGIVGALLAYFFIKFFGHLFTLIIVIYLLILLTLNIARFKINFIHRLALFLASITAICYIFSFYYKDYYAYATTDDRLFFERIYYFLDALFGKVGTPILLFVLTIASLLFIFTFNPFAIFYNCCRAIKRFVWDGWKLPRRKPIEAVTTPTEEPTPTNEDDTTDTTPTPAPAPAPPPQPKPINISEANIHIGPDEIKRVKDPDEPAHDDTSKITPVKVAHDESKYQKPDIDQFLFKPPADKKHDKEKLAEEIKAVSQILIDKLMEFNLVANVLNVNVGPIITQYELDPAPGIKVREFTALSDDLALALKALSIRVQAPIPGRGLIGVEVPNKTADVIYMHDIFFSPEMKGNEALLAVALGKDIAGHPIVTDLVKMPHLLIAGATGAGKSVCINTIICSLLLRCTPEEVRLVMIDPKRIELSGYEDIPHLIQNVVTEPEDALNALNWAVYEMERRYEMLQEVKVRDIVSYNQKIDELIKTEEAEVIDRLPYIVVIVDEFADLIMTAGKEIELPITRLAQMARAVGIHLILATQRPSTKVITGVIKANFPARIAFRVTSQVDSRVILDSNGAEKLLGRGDMLFLPPGKATPERIHGAYLSDSEIEGLVEYLRTQPKPHLNIEMNKPERISLGEFEYDDDLFPEAVKVVVIANTASVSMLQRHFKIGYARAGRLIDLLERSGVIGPHLGSKSREVLMTKEDLNNTWQMPV